MNDLKKDGTIIFNVDDMENYTITETLMKVRNALNEKGYNGINQIVGYLLSGDLAYISNYKDSRNLLQKLEREKIIEALLKYYLRDL